MTAGCHFREGNEPCRYPSVSKRALHETFGTKPSHVISSASSLRLQPDLPTCLSLKTESTQSTIDSGIRSKILKTGTPNQCCYLLTSFHAWISFCTREVTILRVTWLQWQQARFGEVRNHRQMIFLPSRPELKYCGLNFVLHFMQLVLPRFDFIKED